MVRLPSLFKRYRYVLRGRNPQGVWEDLGEYDKPITLAEVSDVVMEYREQGYTTFRVDVYDRNDKFVKRLWTRTYPKKNDSSDRKLTLDDIKKYAEAIKTVKDALGIKDLDPEDVIANIIYWDTLKEKLAEKLKTVGGGGELKEFLDLLNALRGIQLPTTVQAPNPTSAPTPQPSNVKPVVVENKEKLVEDLVSKALEETDKVLQPPCVEEGTCKEGGSE